MYKFNQIWINHFLLLQRKEIHFPNNNINNIPSAFNLFVAIYNFKKNTSQILLYNFNKLKLYTTFVSAYFVKNLLNKYSIQSNIQSYYMSYHISKFLKRRFKRHIFILTKYKYVKITKYLGFVLFFKGTIL